MAIIRLTVQRTTPGQPAAATYTLELAPERVTLLDALLQIQQEQDGSLALRYNCRNVICGSCALTVNGQPGLACQKTVAEWLQPGSDTLHIGPLPHLPVIRDLVVDMKAFWQGLVRVQPMVQGGPAPDGSCQPNAIASRRRPTVCCVGLATGPATAWWGTPPRGRVCGAPCPGQGATVAGGQPRWRRRSPPSAIQPRGFCVGMYPLLPVQRSVSGGGATLGSHHRSKAGGVGYPQPSGNHGPPPSPHLGGNGGRRRLDRRKPVCRQSGGLARLVVLGAVGTQNAATAEIASALAVSPLIQPRAIARLLTRWRQPKP
ncbi:MAG: 2Fe-2S iron-sulfur cluster binding domain-containing protein [Oscillatoriales cyanobacterium SM2_1_8]|nr:2Fe-2S iron-sulfur cluster binding domain-containing protein [Oscillatoriales cyanobacterium SM2_1_8]